MHFVVNGKPVNGATGEIRVSRFLGAFDCRLFFNATGKRVRDLPITLDKVF